jgi:hypothetical protein
VEGSGTTRSDCARLGRSREGEANGMLTKPKLIEPISRSSASWAFPVSVEGPGRSPFRGAFLHLPFERGAGSRRGRAPSARAPRPDDRAALAWTRVEEEPPRAGVPR